MLLIFQTEPTGGIFTHLKNEPATYDHPYVLLIGPLNEITKSLVVYRDIAYNCTSPTAAVDLCSKWFFALDQKYPHTCQHIYSFLQIYVYELGQKRKKAVAVNSIYKAVQALSLITT